ncbi:ribonucleotide reductase inhibitor-domain-containing protein [Bisporella sp. PMI_857]|nr:ribonucleotide reductase inhibitor-domain-containing protein [Bisporella sp. PMI_857]
MAPTHQHKRPYAGSQPSITSYFAPSVSPTDKSPQLYSITQATAPETSAPSLPASVQSNLLSVGMRVRKSVPEGYKTGTYSAFTLFSDATPAVPAQERKQPAAETVMRTRPRARELTPFCGLLKIGGLQQQAWGIYAPLEEEEVDEDEDCPPLSQGSTISNVSAASTAGAKRRRMSFDEDTGLGRSEILGDRPLVCGLGGRAMAIPRRKRTDGKKVDSAVVGQENMDESMDFGEADFLDYELIDGEIEMGGI